MASYGTAETDKLRTNVEEQVRRARPAPPPLASAAGSVVPTPPSSQHHFDPSHSERNTPLRACGRAFPWPVGRMAEFDALCRQLHRLLQQLQDCEELKADLDEVMRRSSQQS